MENDTNQVLETAMEAGHILLENGAEIFRVEETMHRISKYFGVDKEERDFYILTNGLFASGKHNGELFARVRNIPVHGAQLDKVVAINQLSREIEEGKYTLDEVREKLREIKSMPEQPRPLQILASGAGAAGFCYMLGGGVMDSLAAFTAGLLLRIFIMYIVRGRMSKIVTNICGGALVTLVCAICRRIGFGVSMSHMIIGSIMPLVPGVAFTNGIRDIADGDYLSGAVRLLDAMLVFMSIALGVVSIFTVYHKISGGVALW